MPLGFERLNERTQRPNALINFIKPKPGPDENTSVEFLNRIAAQCYPVMKANYITVMSLAEHEPNPEFLGRNFNAGELIELVLKDKQGHWLGFKFVQMVMMHELAHCKQMNHSKFFWQVRNGYASEMEVLWANGYSGEGLWGRGKELESGSFVHDRAPLSGDVPEHLCGGTYRRKGRKRKRGGAGAGAGAGAEAAGDGLPKLSYAERQQKRIARKFGTHGDGAALGDDEMVRGALESAAGKRHAGKPRVAQSKRGRELRAQAALARFEAAKPVPVKEEPAYSDSETEWEDDFEPSGTNGFDDLIKVCGDEGENEEGGQDEMDQLRGMTKQEAPAVQSSIGITEAILRYKGFARSQPSKNHIDSETESETEGKLPPAKNARQLPRDHIDPETESEVEENPPTSQMAPPKQNAAPTDAQSRVTATASKEADETASSHIPPAPVGPPRDLDTCPICSLLNEPNSPTCMACANVLRPSLMPSHWRCTSEACKGSAYINAGDAGRCGICGAQKPKKVTGAGAGARPPGLISNDVLRWD